MEIECSRARTYYFLIRMSCGAVMRTMTKRPIVSRVLQNTDLTTLHRLAARASSKCCRALLYSFRSACSEEHRMLAAVFDPRPVAFQLISTVQVLQSTGIFVRCHTLHTSLYWLKLRKHCKTSWPKLLAFVFARHSCPFSFCLVSVDSNSRPFSFCLVSV